MALFDHVVVPIASQEDADATASALVPFLDDVHRVTAVHVIEKAGGAIDKAPMEKRREDSAVLLERFESQLDDRVEVDSRIEFGTDVVEAIFETASDAGGSAIVVRPRGGSRIVRLLTGDIANRLVTDPSVPVVSLPRGTEDPLNGE